MVVSPEKEKILIRHVHLGARKVKAGKDPSELGFKVLRAIFPDLYEALIDLTFEEAIDILNRHRNDNLIKEDIEILLSPEGIEYLKKVFEIIKKFSKEEMEERSR